MKLLLVPVVASLLAVARADTNKFGSSELYVVTDTARAQTVPSSYSSSSTGFSERSDHSPQSSSLSGAQSFQPSSYSSLFESSGAQLGFGTPRPYSNFRRNDLQTSGFGASFGAPGLLQTGASPAGSISNFLGGYSSGAQGLGSDFGLQQGGFGGLFGAQQQQQAFNPYQMQQFQSQFGGLGGGQGFSQLQQPLQHGSGAEAFSRYALPGQGFQGSALGQQGLLSGAQYLGGGGQNFPTANQLPFGVQAALRQAQSMQQPFFTPRGTQAFGNGFSGLQPHFGGALGGFGNGGGSFGGGGGRGSSSSSGGGRGSSRGSGSSVTSRLFAPLTQLASSLYGSSDDDTRRADSSQRTRGFLNRGSLG